jgi:predicted Rossmann fold nucleotide-binding protein DprA/Smf involved in DNA uptake
MKIAIVGSRTYPQLKLVEWFVRDIPLGVVIVSGGADGVDAAAIEYAKRRGMETREHMPNLEGCKAKHEYAERYYARNQKIVDDCDLLVAFTERDSGGTWDTIKRARKAGKPLKIVKPSLMFPGDAGELDLEEKTKTEDEMQPEEVSPQQTARTANKGKGPFAIKRVSLGSYALRRKCYIDGEEWAEIVTDKDNNPQQLAEKLIPDFVKFFETNKRLGYIHAITVPPRSKRNLAKQHAMDIAAKAVANQLGVEFVQLFEPWEKSSRGRYAKHGEIAVMPEVSKYIGKVVWVLDDVTTTNFTLRSAVQSLMAMEIHAHGLAYVLMA